MPVSSEPPSNYIHTATLSSSALNRPLTSFYGDILKVHDHFVRVGQALGPSYKLATVHIGRCGSCDDPNHTYIVKIEKLGNFPSLEAEFSCYNRLAGMPGIPRVHFFGNSPSYRYLVLDLLGPTLAALQGMRGGVLNLQTAALIGDQVLTRLQTIHDCGVIHRDIKPDNFVLGTEDNRDLIFVIDFAYAKCYEQEDGSHIAQLPHKKMVIGTTTWASLEAHLGHTLSRRDDLESAAYMLIGFQKDLPWQSATGWEEVHAVKRAASSSSLCEGLHPFFANFLDYTRSLGFDEEPDYETWRKKFQKLWEGDNLATLEYPKSPAGGL